MLFGFFCCILIFFVFGDTIKTLHKLNILLSKVKCVFLSFGKNTCSIFAYFILVSVFRFV